MIIAGLPQSGKNIWKMNFFPGQGKVKEFCGGPGKFRKDLESQGKVRELENKCRQSPENLFSLFKRGKIDSLMRESKPISLFIGRYS